MAEDPKHAPTRLLSYVSCVQIAKLLHERFTCEVYQHGPVYVLDLRRISATGVPIPWQTRQAASLDVIASKAARAVEWALGQTPANRRP